MGKVDNSQNLKFLDDAMMKIVEAKKVDAISYVLGYYMDSNYDGKKLFEYQQTMLERTLELLQK